MLRELLLLDNGDRPKHFPSSEQEESSSGVVCKRGAGLALEQGFTRKPGAWGWG